MLTPVVWIGGTKEDVRTPQLEKLIGPGSSPLACMLIKLVIGLRVGIGNSKMGKRMRRKNTQEGTA